MNGLHRDLHSPLRRRKYNVVKFIVQATGHAELAGLTALAGVSGCSPNKARVMPCANTPEPKCLDINSNEV